jgi:hypothetical protein
VNVWRRGDDSGSDSGAGEPDEADLRPPTDD